MTLQQITQSATTAEKQFTVSCNYRWHLVSFVLSYLHSQIHHPQDTVLGMDEQAPSIRMELQHVNWDADHVPLINFLHRENMKIFTAFKFHLYWTSTSRLLCSRLCYPFSLDNVNRTLRTFSIHQRWHGWNCLLSGVPVTGVFHTMIRPALSAENILPPSYNKMDSQL